MMIHVLAVPYDSGHRARRMGMGPLHILERGRVSDRLRLAAANPLLHLIEHDLGFPTEIGTAFALHRALAGKVAEALGQNAFPIVLSGNCNSSLGTLAGLQQVAGAPVGVIWFDGHGDCNTPETFTGDFLDAMGLSTLTGLCWQALATSVSGFKPVSEQHVLLVGGHGMDQGARQVLSRSRIAHVPTAEIKATSIEAALEPYLDRLKTSGIRRVYIHLDVDVLDADYAPANEFAPKGGLLPPDLTRALQAIAASFEIAAAAVASYDPACDRDDRILNSALEFIEHVARLSRRHA